MKAMQQDRGAVLLIDEVDKSDYEFESLLLEILSDYQVSVPEIGTIKATVAPMVFLTSNNSRDISDALKRRCLHLYIPFPTVELEERIVRSRVPDIDEQLRHQLVEFVHSLRQLDLKKAPAISETIDWARSLLLLHADQLDEALLNTTLNVLLKFQDDIEAISAHLRISLQEMMDKYARKVGKRMSLREAKKTKDCVFLETAHDGQRRCSIYSYRPTQCLTWPFWQSNIGDQDDWLLAGVRCIGINRGKLHTLEEIETRRDATRE